MNVQEIVKSKKTKIGIGIIGGVMLVLIIFALGINVGFHKAKFSCLFGENYERNFMGRHMGFSGGPMPVGPPMGKFADEIEGRGFRNAHGISGIIISIADNKIIIKDKNNNENIISISEGTVIRSGNDNLKLENLKSNDEIVVMGKPGEDGTISADLIRLFKAGENN